MTNGLQNIGGAMIPLLNQCGVMPFLILNRIGKGSYEPYGKRFRI